MVSMFWILLASTSIGTGSMGDESTIFVGPMALEAIHSVELEEPVEIKTRGQVHMHRDFLLLVSRPMAKPIPPHNAAPPDIAVDVPVVIPILHVNEHRALLVYYDRKTGVFGWLVPKVEMEKALVWYLLMTEDSTLFWESSFWERNPTLSQIAESAVLIEPATDAGARTKLPTYLPAEIATAKGKDRPTLHSMVEVRSASEKAAKASDRASLELDAAERGNRK